MSEVNLSIHAANGDVIKTLEMRLVPPGHIYSGGVKVQKDGENIDLVIIVENPHEPAGPAPEVNLMCRSSITIDVDRIRDSVKELRELHPETGCKCDLYRLITNIANASGSLRATLTRHDLYEEEIGEDDDE